ncbi:dicarboxylate transporter/tellurite-resistance protein TehA [Pararhizobium sp. DWP3-4]|uniref:dicarboxylate transporter/tellurite-resistance protein TehA n=1 Tax=unclassified Pararhizobium TaxID=2643050 RepID=UPI003CE9E87A
MTLPLVPASFFGIVLGLAGLGSAWRAASKLWGLPPVIGEIISLAAVAVWILLAVLYGLKWILAKHEALAEARHPVRLCFIGLVGVSAMLVALALLPYSKAGAWTFFIAGCSFAFSYAIWSTGRLWRGARDPGTTTAALYLPTVATCFVSVILLGVLGHPDWGQLAFGAGMFTWLAIESVLLQRMLTVAEMPEEMRPTLGIQLAPPAVGCVAYLSITTGPPDTFAHILLGYAILQALLLFRLGGWILAHRFAASYWSVAFGASALASSAVRMVERGEVGAVATLAPYLFLVGNVIVGLIAAGTIYLIAKGRMTPMSPMVKPVGGEIIRLTRSAKDVQ